MAVTALDPKTALIVVDLQKGIVALSATHSIDSVAYFS
jgi:nicotinamidase-related amidase